MLPAVVAVTATMTGTLSWAPIASAQNIEPDPSTSTATPSTPHNAAETGGLAILKKDPGGDTLTGATFALFDSAGSQAGTGKTDREGRVAFADLAPGVYRLKEVSSGSSLHDTVADQDVIITPGSETPMTIIDPFKPAAVVFKAKDDDSGKLLRGSTVTIGNGGGTLLTLTTGPAGTATAQLPVNSRERTEFWVKQTRAPEGYDLYKPERTFKARPGDTVTVTVANAKITRPPSPSASKSPSSKPSPGKPAPGKPTPGGSTGGIAPTTSSTSAGTENSVPQRPTASATTPVREGSLANTGADTTVWLLGGAGLLLAAGGGAVIAVRRRRSADESSNVTSVT
ncbi:collagen binding domain-containing protein [Streptomyces cyaneofuscatus]|uniref:MSCRAMM family protein n=1 Tax=Streptomyces cyaneofuscatus TaxID=66883 RepID=UPI0036BC8361